MKEISTEELLQNGWNGIGCETANDISNITNKLNGLLAILDIINEKIKDEDLKTNLGNTYSPYFAVCGSQIALLTNDFITLAKETNIKLQSIREKITVVDEYLKVIDKDFGVMLDKLDKKDEENADS
jgi:hypothetical protein